MVLGPHSFLHSITTSGETISKYLFQHGKLSKNNYNLGKYLTLHLRCAPGF